MKINDQVVSRQMKPIKNTHIREILNKYLPNGSDGEICFSDSTFQDVTSNVMTKDKKIDGVFLYYWFDYVKDSANKPYEQRMEDIREYMENHKELLENAKKNEICIIPLYPTVVNTLDELNKYEEEKLEEGYEGVILRKGSGKYKMGRSTFREGILLKLKRFADDEAEVISLDELQINNNETDAITGKKSSKKDGLSAGGMLGSFKVKKRQVDGTDIIFNIGSGMTHEQRKEFWGQKEELIGKMIKYKYFEIGIKVAPRFPVFLGIRDPSDM
jgi:DNA ligase-1